MEEFVITRDRDRDIRFVGELIAEVDNSLNGNGPRGRWFELRIYRTKGGRYVCSRIGRTHFQHEVDRHEAVIVDDHSGIIAFFGAGGLAKAIYAIASVDATEYVD